VENEVFLSVEGLSKHYGDLAAVDHISFSVCRGEVFGLLGPNGAGKTTTIKMLCGLIKADAGEIVYDGLSMASDYDRIKSMIGLCPQDIVIWEYLTCLEQLKFVGMSYGLSSQKAVKSSEYLLDTLGLLDKKNKLASTLSGGMQRRLNIALALVHDPKIIILDEPQAGLDPQSRILVRDFIRQLAKRKTVILTTHDMDEADRLSDKVAIVDHGKILIIDTPEKLKEKNGASDIIQIRTSENNQVKINQFLSALPPVFTEKEYSDGLLLLSASNAVELIAAITKMLKDYHIQMDDINLRKRTLEDAFISLTGRGLRE
jgi:ABC-type multidrug transport system, ATPase component